MPDILGSWEEAELVSCVGFPTSFCQDQLIAIS